MFQSKIARYKEIGNSIWSTELESKFSEGVTKMAIKHIKKYATSIVIRETKIKSILRFYLALVRMSKVNNTSSTSGWQGCVVMEILIDCLWDCTVI